MLDWEAREAKEEIKAKWGVSIAFRLNARLGAAALSQECFLRSHWVSIAFRLNARLGGDTGLRLLCPASDGLNCLSAECSIGRALVGERVDHDFVASQLPFG